MDGDGCNALHLGRLRFANRPYKTLQCYDM